MGVKKIKSVWRYGDSTSTANAVAHLCVGTRARCANGGFPRGRIVPPPSTGKEVGYCYNCHYHFIFDTLPGTKRKVLVPLMNRELERLVFERTETFRKSLEEREKAVSSRREENDKYREELRKKEAEIENLRHKSKDDERLVEVGKAFGVLSESIGESIMKASMKMYRGYPGDGFSRW